MASRWVLVGFALALGCGDDGTVIASESASGSTSEGSATSETAGSETGETAGHTGTASATGTATGTASGTTMMTTAGPTTSTSTGSTDPSTTSDSSTTSGSSHCDYEPELIYFTTWADKRLLSFDPVSYEVEFLGYLECSDGTGPSATAFPRTGGMWGYFSDDAVSEVDLTDLSCVQTNFVAGPQTPKILSMTFTPDAPGSEDETLYATYVEGDLQEGPRFFGTFDTEQHTLAELGPLDHKWMALAGRTDATLHGMLPAYDEPEVSLLELEKADGATLSQEMVTNSSGWPIAFVWWGGDVWLFGNFFGTHGVFRYDVETQEIETIIENLVEAADIDSFSLVTGAGPTGCGP